MRMFRYREASDLVSDCFLIKGATNLLATVTFEEPGINKFAINASSAKTGFDRTLQGFWNTVCDFTHYPMSVKWGLLNSAYFP